MKPNRNQLNQFEIREFKAKSATPNRNLQNPIEIEQTHMEIDIAQIEFSRKPSRNQPVPKRT